MVALLASVLVGVGGTAAAAPQSRGKTDRTPPQVAVTAPAGGATVAGEVTVTGTASDKGGVSSVSVSVDGGHWSTASGTGSWSWQWATASMTDGSHTLTARAVDSNGNAATTSVTVTVANAPASPPADTTPPTVSISAPATGATVSGTVAVSGSAGDDAALSRVEVRVDGGAWQQATGSSSWTWSWATAAVTDGTHTLTARATDQAGNTTSTSRSVTVANSASSGDSGGSTGVWTSPEGVRIDIQTTTGGWTHDKIQALLLAHGRNLGQVGPSLRVVVQDVKGTVATISASTSGGTYTSVSATIQLDARSGSGFSNRPDDVLAHEYGHVWFRYYGYLRWQGDLSSYRAKRWVAADGSTTLATDSRTGSTYTWSVDEIAADDYRLLLAGEHAVTQRNSHMNQQIVDPRNQPGLREWFVSTWAG